MSTNEIRIDIKTIGYYSSNLWKVDNFACVGYLKLE